MKIRDIITEADTGQIDLQRIALDAIGKYNKDKAKQPAPVKQQKPKPRFPDKSSEWQAGYRDGERDYRDRGAGEAYGPRYGEYLAGFKAGQKARSNMGESSTAGATSSGSIASVEAPHLSPGTAKGKKSYLGKPGSHGGTKAPPQPKVKQPKKRDGTAVNALDMGASLFGKGAVKR